jgi:hypothetical protein
MILGQIIQSLDKGLQQHQSRAFETTCIGFKKYLMEVDDLSLKDCTGDLRQGLHAK